MTITVNSPIVGPPSGSLATALDYAGTDNADYVRELYRLCGLVGIDPAIMFAQAAHETADFSSFYWETRRNPAGIGITGTPAQDAASQTWANGTDAARGHVAHMAAYVYGDNWSHSWREQTFLPPDVDARFGHVLAQGWSTTRTINELTGRWATDPQYAEKIVTKHRAIFGITDDAIPPERNNVSTPATIDYSRLPFPVRVNYVPVGQTNNRPGIPMTPTSGTWHETANYATGADAATHERWLLNGAPGAADAQVCVHFFVDDHEAVQMLPLNEVAWHAGDGVNGPGNTSSISVECCVNSDGDLAKAQNNMTELFGLLRSNGIIGDVFQHNHWSGKDCPHLLRQGNVIGWGIAQSWIKASANEYSAPVTPQPDPIWWTPGVDVGPVKRASDGAVALAMLGEVTTDRTVPIYRNAAMRKEDIIETWTHGTTGKIGGTYLRPNGLGKKPTRVAFVQTSDGGWGRARLSAFSPSWPTT